LKMVIIAPTRSQIPNTTLMKKDYLFKNSNDERY
jgi:hypothetical protein